jgi:hypothetical protein
MTSNADWLPRLRGGLRTQRVDQESILLDTENERVHQLNELGTFILDRCDGTRTVAGIVSDIVVRYEVPEAVATRDTIDLLDRMKALQIVE